MYYKYVQNNNATYYISVETAKFRKDGLVGTYIYHSCYDRKLSLPYPGGLFLWSEMKSFELVHELPV